MKKNSERLTRGEEEVMQILWSLGQACCNDIIARFPDPKPKYTTVATFIKILENKGFVSHRQVGKVYIYTPLVGKEQYARRMMKSMLTDYFDGSFARLVSFFSESDDISVEETDEIIGIAENFRNRWGGEAAFLRGLLGRGIGVLHLPYPIKKTKTTTFGSRFRFCSG